MPHIPDAYWIVGQCVCIVLAATAILPLLPVDVWWIRIGDFPRVQFLISYTVMLAVMSCFRSVRDDKWWMALMLGCAIVQVVKIYP